MQSEWPSDLYHDLKDYNGLEIDLLRRRKFHQLACENEFQQYYDQITKNEAVKMALGKRFRKYLRTNHERNELPGYPK